MVVVYVVPPKVHDVDELVDVLDVLVVEPVLEPALERALSEVDTAAMSFM